MSWSYRSTQTISGKLRKYRESGLPCLTITSNSGYARIVPSGNRRQPEDLGGSRHLLAEEGARIQSFSEDFCFYGNKNQKFLQIGNAVPPLVARAVLESLWA